MKKILFLLITTFLWIRDARSHRSGCTRELYNFNIKSGKHLGKALHIEDVCDVPNCDPKHVKEDTPFTCGCRSSLNNEDVLSGIDWLYLLDESPRDEQLEVKKESVPIYNVNGPQIEPICESPNVEQTVDGVKQEAVAVCDGPNNEDVYESPRDEKLKEVKEETVPVSNICEPCNFDIKSCEPCDGKGPQNIDEYWSPRDEQLVKVKNVLKCTPGSYFSKIIFDKPTPINISCNGYQQQEDNSGEVDYIGITRPDKRRVELKKDSLLITFATINGNAIVSGRASLVENECKGGPMFATAIYLLDEPTTGCCGRDTPSVKYTAIAHELKIYGKCSSTCTLQKGSMELEHNIKNK